MSNFFKKFSLTILLVLFICLSFAFGYVLGKNQPVLRSFQETNLNIINNTGPISGDETIDMEPFWKTWNLLNDKYVATKKLASTTVITSQDRVWGAIQGMTSSLGDPYTVFMPPEDNKDFTENISGNFEGVGMEIGIKDGVLSVISPLKGSPAEKAGIKTGDKIITIDGQTAVDLSTDKAVKLIRGSKGTVVKITVLRNGDTKPISFEITRAVIDIPTTKTETKGDVFVIGLYNFYAQAQPQFNIALKEFVASKKNKLILDLRGNPGGYLDAAVNMASWFLPGGKPVVREEFGTSKEEVVYRSKGYNIFNENLKMIILVDGGSASASEILAGALQEYNIAKLVGMKTYGKGSVQELVKVTEDTSLKVTVAKWLTPNGKSISEGGLTPDYEVKITEADIKAEKDPQMDKALELLK
jgi:carboxyl-terminal processing protease